MVNINVALKVYNSEMLESPRVAAVGGNTIYYIFNVALNFMCFFNCVSFVFCFCLFLFSIFLNFFFFKCELV